jgi:hypothetical protein
MKFMYDPDHDRVLVEGDALPYQVSEQEATIIAYRKMYMALESIAQALNGHAQQPTAQNPARSQAASRPS